MTQTTSPDGLVLRAADLSHAAPREWAGFLEEFRTYVELQSKQCVQAPLAMLQVAQGRAQNAAQLLGLLETAVVKAAAITTARQHK